VVIVIVLNIAGGQAKMPVPIRVTDVLQLLGMMAVWVGVFLAWKWPLAGAALMLSGYVLFEGTTYVRVGHFAGRWFLVFPAIAVAHLIYWGMLRRRTA
jgi:hypothetical protein